MAALAEDAHLDGLLPMALVRRMLKEEQRRPQSRIRAEIEQGPTRELWVEHPVLLRQVAELLIKTRITSLDLAERPVEDDGLGRGDDRLEASPDGCSSGRHAGREFVS
jgi:hypothetical protein